MRGDEKLVAAIREHMGGWLYHWTDATHLPSIEQHGLLSERARVAVGIVPAFPGGNELTRALDADYGLTDFVFLSFIGKGVMPAHKGERWRRRPGRLRIYPEILLLPGVRVALGCANHRGTRIYAAARAFDKMDWDIWFNRDENDSQWKPRLIRFLDYEILVPHCVPVDYIATA